jgi:fido (protein-threonine AMPylation protein)/predicted transcriptional regulator
MRKITRWDVFFTLVNLRNEKKSSVSIVEISKTLKASKKSVYNQLRILINKKLVIKADNYLPKINPRQGSIYYSLIKIYEFSTKNRVNYNLLLNKNLFAIVGSKKSTLELVDIKGIHYETFKKYLSLMLKLSFAMIIKQKPLKIRLLHHPILQDIYIVNKKVYSDKLHYFNSKDEEFYLKSISEMINSIDAKSVKFKKIDKKQRILFIAHTTQLEGNPMQFTEVKDLIENNKTFDYEKNVTRENKNMDAAMNMMEQFRGTDLTLAKIKKVHYQVQKYLDKDKIPWKKIAGKRRDVSVRISNNPKFKLSPVTQIDVLLESFIIILNNGLERLKKIPNTPLNLKKKIEFATWVHSEFQHVHPFIDGNSRTTRILFNHVLTEFSIPLTDIYFVKEYIDVTKGETSRDDKKLYSFFLHLIYDNMLRLISEMES